MAAPAVKVYGWAVLPFVARALLCLEEAGIEYEIVLMSRDAGDHRLPDFLARNPFGQVPVLEDGDLILFESRAIARHVLRKHQPELLHGSDGSLESAAAVDMWLEVEAHHHHEATDAIVVNCIISPLLGCGRDQAAVDKSAAKLRGVLEVRLSASRYLAGDSVSLADLSHFPLMRYFMETEYESLVDACVSKDLSKSPSLLVDASARKVLAVLPVRATNAFFFLLIDCSAMDAKLYLYTSV